MRAVVQRVLEASVSVQAETVGDIGAGLCVLVGVGKDDTQRDAEQLVHKVCNLRVFRDAADKMNLSLLDVKGSLLAVSQFTLFGDVRRGHRPSFGEAMEPQQANRLFEAFCNGARALGVDVETGRFGASMQVGLVNDGPVTILLDTKRTF